MVAGGVVAKVGLLVVFLAFVCVVTGGVVAKVGLLVVFSVVVCVVTGLREVSTVVGCVVTGCVVTGRLC